ncbi:SGNH/GDSL hydrolase family protein [Ningiella sp. W23]|uniref:SGNH/GDSL hydrolase family protein n=1 Tax=Ningiella sp. W23 TaxID=3023715 RepID=UPI0037581C54
MKSCRSIFQSRRLAYRLMIFVCFGILWHSILLGATNGRAAPSLAFQHQDTVVFIGDSITHAGSYHGNLALYYATRLPDRYIRFINAGISGDTAKGTLARFDKDIAIHKPTRASIMLGMNDVNRGIYEHPPLTAAALDEFEQQQLSARQTYINNMNELLDQLSDMETDTTILTPSIYDQTLQAERTNMFGVNDELANYARLMSRYAKERDLAVIDFQSPMLAINQDIQVKDPTLSIVGPDRIHPGETGHFVMFYQMLTSHFKPSRVASIFVDLNKKTHKMHSCDLSDIEYQQSKVLNGKSADILTMSCALTALPFPISTSQHEALKFVPFEDKYNQFSFTVIGLEKGVYGLSINGKAIDSFESDELRTGINLSNYDKAPFFEPARKIREVNQLRVDTEKALRDLLQVQFSMLGQYPESMHDSKQGLISTLDAHVEKSRGKPWHRYMRQQADNYLQNASNIQVYRDQARLLNIQMYEIYQAKEYEFVLTKK